MATRLQTKILLKPDKHYMSEAVCLLDSLASYKRKKLPDASLVDSRNCIWSE